MAEYRLTHMAQEDIVEILMWSDEQFGNKARRRYETLIAAAIRDAASSMGTLGRTPRPELGDGIFSWHLTQSRAKAPGKSVYKPRHFLICREDGEVLIIGRVLHDAMDLQRHMDSHREWE